VERTFAWLSQFRRLRIRYERRADIHEALLFPRLCSDLLAFSAKGESNNLSRIPCLKCLNNLRNRPSHWFLARKVLWRYFSAAGLLSQRRSGSFRPSAHFPS
jgi:hypothetical protein